MQRLHRPLILCLLLVAFLWAPTACDTSAGDGTTADLLTQVEERGVLRIGMEAGYEPFEMRAPDGTLVGLDVEMGRAIGAKLGVEVEFIDTAWDGIFSRLAIGDFDIIISGVTATDERRESMDFSTPYVHTGQSLLIREDLADTIHSVADLDDPRYHVVVKTGTTGSFAAEEYLPRLNATPGGIRQLTTEADCANEVRLGNADAMVYDQPFVVAWLAHNPEAGVVGLLEPFTEEALAVAVPKGEAELLAAMNTALSQLEADGTLDRLRQYYLLSTEWLERLEDEGTD